MLTIKLEGMDKLEAKLRGMQKQIPFATSLAINNIARGVESEIRRAIGGSAFDRVKPQTVRATYVKRSTKQNLVAEIGLKNRQMGIPASEYLHATIRGGSRGRKRSEIMLQQAGILPAGMFAVPGAGATLDAYGNMSRGQIVSILSYFRTFGNTTLNSKRMNMTDRSRALRSRKKTDYFVVPVADRALKLYPGIWQRTESNDIKPLLLFVSRVQYRAILDFYGISQRYVTNNWKAEWALARERSFATAR